MKQNKIMINFLTALILHDFSLLCIQ